MGAHLLAGGSFEGLLLKWRHELGPYYEFQIPGNPPVMIVTDPDAIKQVFEEYQYPKSPRYADLLPILGPQSMLTTEGEEWRAQRDAFNPGFSSSFLRSALSGFVESSQHLVELLGRKADAGEVVRIHHLAILTTLEIICKVGFGEDVNLLLSEKPPLLFRAFEGIGRHVAFFLDNVPINSWKNFPWNIQKGQRLQEDYDRQLLPILIKRLREMGINVTQEQQQQLLSRSGRSGGSSGGSHAGTSFHGVASSSSSGSKGGDCPVPGVSAGSSSSSSPPSSNATSSSSSSSSSECPFHVDGSTTAAASTHTSSSSSSNGASGMQERQQVSAAATEALMLDSKDILSLAVRLGEQQGAAQGSGLDLEMLLSQMKTFFAAGHDTTASLVGWSMWYLVTHPEAEAKLAQEVLRVMGPDSQPSWQQLADMRYLNAVLKESLRVRPPVGVVARYAPPGSSLSGFNTSGKILLVSPYLQHMDQDAWGPDAAAWRPERWLEEGGAAGRVSQYSYLPFSRGPRDCIGSRFALLEARTILAMMYRHFEFEFAGDRPEEVLMSVTAHPRFGVPLRVRRRGMQMQQQQEEEQAAVRSS